MEVASTLASLAQAPLVFGETTTANPWSLQHAACRSLCPVSPNFAAVISMLYSPADIRSGPGPQAAVMYALQLALLTEEHRDPQASGGALVPTRLHLLGRSLELKPAVMMMWQSMMLQQSSLPHFRRNTGNPLGHGELCPEHHLACLAAILHITQLWLCLAGVLRRGCASWISRPARD